MRTVASPTIDNVGTDESGVRVRHWTVEDFFRAVNMNFFEHPERLELIDGEVVERMTAQNDPHFTHVHVATIVLGKAFGPECVVRQQGPFQISDKDYVEPDVLVVKGTYLDYLDKGPDPSDVILVMEVSDTTLAFDRNRKAALYAEAGVPEYWLLNLNARCLEVRRDPMPTPDNRYGFGYRQTILYQENEMVTPLAAPQADIQLKELLPKPQAGQ